MVVAAAVDSMAVVVVVVVDSTVVVATAVADTGNSSKADQNEAAAGFQPLQPLFSFQVRRESIAIPTSFRPPWWLRRSGRRTLRRRARAASRWSGTPG